MQGLTPKRIKGIIVAGAVIILYAVAGFFVLPPILQPKIVDAIRTQTGCEASLGNLRINPFALSVTAMDFALLDRERRAIVSFKELYVNFETSSLFRMAFTFDKIYLSSPRIHVGVRADGTVNLSDIRRPPDEPPVTEEQPPMRVIVHDLAIDSGKIEFEDLTRPGPFHAAFDSLGLSLKEFTTLPDETGEYQFEGSTGSNEFIRWKGKFSIVPLHSSGSFSLSNIQGNRLLEYVQHLVNFSFVSGTADVRADYSFDLTHHTPAFELHNGALNVENVLLASAIDNVEAVRLPKFSMSGIEASYLKKEISVGMIGIDNLSLTNFMSADGKRITLRDMFRPKPQPGDAPKKPKPLEWSILLKEFVCRGANLHNEDRSTTPTAKFDIDSLGISLKNFRLNHASPAEISLRAIVNRSGVFTTKGTLAVNIDTISLDVLQDAELTGLSLEPFQPYINTFLKVDLKSGKISGRSKARFVQRGSVGKMEFAGDIQCSSFCMTDTVLHEDFLRFSQVDVKKLSYSQFTNDLVIGEISARQPYMRFIVGPDRITNIQNMMVKANVDSDSTARQRAPMEKNAGEGKPAMRVRVGNVRILDGSLKFSDLSLTPNFAVGVEQMSGTIRKLSSDELSRADVDLAGNVDKYAPAVIKGQINPLSEEAYTDLTMSFHGIDLTTFTPYSGRFAGYKIEKGKMNIDLHYRLNKSRLEGENKIVLEQLTLGEKVESPDATSLPVKLAVALLKDSHGVIDIDIPVSGDINDPDFSVMPLVVKGLVNVTVKVIAAPFKFIGSLFGGDEEELNLVEFAAGSDSLMMRERAKLSTLAKGLNEKSELSLEIRGIVVDSLDRLAIAQAGVLSELRPPISARKSVELWTPEERERLLEHYSEKFDGNPLRLIAAADGDSPQMTAEEKEIAATRLALGKLVDSTAVSVESLRALAHKRADAVKSFLVIDNHVGEERIFLIDINLQAPAKDGLVQMELALQAK